MVATIARKDGLTHWPATIDMRRGRMVVVSTAPVLLPVGRTTELWLIPRNAKPIALGVFTSDQPTTMSVPSAIWHK